MKHIFIIFTAIFLVCSSLNAQSFLKEREKDINKFEEQITLLESSYLAHNTKGLKKGKRVISRIIAREIKRTMEDITKMRHAVNTNPNTSRQQKIDLFVRENRLDIMKLIQEKVIDFDLATVYDYSDRELSGFKNGLNHFKTLMSYNYNTALAIHRIPGNAKWVRTPAEEKPKQ